MWFSFNIGPKLCELFSTVQIAFLLHLIWNGIEYAWPIFFRSLQFCIRPNIMLAECAALSLLWITV